MKQIINIAIDGPGGAGKSTIAKMIARRMNILYIDTGAMYRTVGLFVKEAGADPKNEGEVLPLLSDCKVDLHHDEDGGQRMLLNGRDVTNLIRTPEMSMYASHISALPSVRSFLLDAQRRLAQENSAVMDGRDIGTVVLPRAQVKIFLTAAPQVRAMRRYRELLEKGQSVCYETVLEELMIRDHNDSTREVAPLRPAPDSIIVDTSELTLEQALARVARVIEEGIG